ncbi:MAG: 3-isopropylmalate dehydrogenase [Candidatus Mycalebacterium zealandia]|nr:MAG: 3-isopropylmalate dehydrogenase [Candidatus Mycalebacterium zealandia]
MPKILVIPGDGIGPEVIDAALGVLAEAEKISGVSFEKEIELFGGCSIDKNGVPVTDEVLAKAQAAHAVLLGAVGGEKWENVEHSIKPETGLLTLRKQLETYANLRPAKVYPALTDASTLKKDVVTGTDILVVRELTGGIYFGEPRGINDKPGGGLEGINTLRYSTDEIERVARRAFSAARARKSILTSVDKSNVLESMVLWRETVSKIGRDEFPDVKLDHLYVDNAAMQLIRRPGSFDVILAGNLFGDIISDEAAQLTGSLGMLPSASIGDGGAIYEPVHGSAPDIAGKDIANPTAAILSVAMMLKYSFEMDEIAGQIDRAVESTLDEGFRTPDIYEKGKEKIGCRKMGEITADKLRNT